MSGTDFTITQAAKPRTIDVVSFLIARTVPMPTPWGPLVQPVCSTPMAGAQVLP